MVVVIYIVAICNKKNRRISFVLKNHQSFLPALLNREIIPTSFDSLSDEEKKKIHAISDAEWNEWKELRNYAIDLANKYPHALEDFINVFLSDVKNHKYFKKNTQLFSPQKKKLSVLIDSMTLNELRLISAESFNNWGERETQRKETWAIKRSYPDGYKTYCDLRNLSVPNYSDIIRDQANIKELQELFNCSTRYEGWEEKQNKFCSDFWNILKEVRSQDGRYTYQVLFKKPTRTGVTIDSKFKIWQGFCESFSSFLIDRQTDTYKKNLDKVNEFKRRNRYFFEKVYKQLFGIVEKLQEKVEGNVIVVFIDRCKRNWPKVTYDYHYKHLRAALDEANFKWCNISALYDFPDDGSIKAVFVFDFITSNDELVDNSKLVIEHFCKSVPFLGYYSMVKEYDQKELEKIKDYLKNENEEKTVPHKPDIIVSSPLENEKENITFIKEMFLKVIKHPYFTYLAITNTLVGEASGAEGTKTMWLSNPQLYHFKTKKKNGYICGEYSVDGREKYYDLAVEGKTNDIDDVANYTYVLFKKMGILQEFMLKGKKAIEYMNENEFLAYH
jgi:hypothetical protein